MSDDLGSVVRELANIKNELHKPFQDMDARKRHEDVLKANREMVKWTMVLAFFTALMAIGTFILAYLTAKSIRII